MSGTAGANLDESQAPLRLRRPTLGSVREYGIVASFAAIFITLSIASSIFLTQRNLLNVVDQSSQVGIMACGETIVFIAGGFDLSIGAVYALAGVIAAEASLHGAPTNVALLLGILVGVVVGAVNGILTTVGRINAFITTIATQFIVYGIALAVTGGLLVTATAPSFTTIGEGSFHLITYESFVWLACALVAGVILSRYGARTVPIRVWGKCRSRTARGGQRCEDPLGARSCSQVPRQRWPVSSRCRRPAPASRARRWGSSSR